jgi:4'-phosphopantetheinyl transferase
MVKVYFSNYSRKLNNLDFSRYLHLLPPELEQRIMRFKKWEDQHASLYGKLLLMKALEESGFESDLRNLKYTKYSRPYLENIPDFNISHSGLYAVCAFSFQSKIGVDIEEIKPIAIWDFKEDFSKEEWNSITDSDNWDYWFYYYWTAKEAVIKADGGGLSLSLKKINIRENKTKIGKTPWYIKSVPVDEKYLLQIATDRAVDVDIDLLEVCF